MQRSKVEKELVGRVGPDAAQLVMDLLQPKQTSRTSAARALQLPYFSKDQDLNPGAGNYFASLRHGQRLDRFAQDAHFLPRYVCVWVTLASLYSLACGLRAGSHNMQSQCLHGTEVTAGPLGLGLHALP